jgi:hypothetical protein
MFYACDLLFTVVFSAPGALMVIFVFISAQQLQTIACRPISKTGSLQQKPKLTAVCQ